MTKCQELLKIADEYKRILIKLDEIDMLSDSKKYDKLAVRLENRAAILYGKSRKVLRTFSNIPEETIMRNDAEDLGISVKKNGEVLDIRMPFLLPHKASRNCRNISEPLSFLLRELSMSKRLKLHEKAMICFIHTYNTEDRICRLIDYDNLEVKPILDKIALEVLIDDNPKYCNVLHTMKIAKKEETRIIIMPDRIFEKRKFDKKYIKK